MNLTRYSDLVANFLELNQIYNLYSLPKHDFILTH